MTEEEKLDDDAACRAKAGDRQCPPAGAGAPTTRDLRQASGEAVEHDRVTSRRLARVREEEGRRRAAAPGMRKV